MQRELYTQTNQLINKQNFQSMKTILKFLLMFSAMFVTLALSSCSRKDPTNRMEDYTAADSMFVKSIVNSVLNPSFNKVEDMKDYCLSLKEESHMLDVVLSMDSITIDYVFKVLNPNNESKYVCLKSLVDEYLAHKELFDNITKSELSELERYSPPAEIDSAHSDTMTSSSTN